ncbi:hypothetical protein P8C59_009519 [Phyllachora maydis]|uniref:holo-[acyl-carrier-protein] synthase n=1 Tax=Phyllachora maydis TaxID=1825666 RepID=A0AAD9MIK7_9PEZI|nr:hypothetical protein P8C59_009519 [Phyllachora maydis]
MAATPAPVIAQWILDTRVLWPEATRTSQLDMHAFRALSLIPAADRAAVLRYLHVADAKMSLGSHLLKRHAISTLGHVPWDAATASRHTPTSKPVFVGGPSPVAFNVSHQAGLVALVAVAGYRGDGEAGGDDDDDAVEVGVDLVCASERRARDLDMIHESGWPSFVDMYADVFGRGEAAYLKYQVLVPDAAAAAARGGMPPPGPGASPEAQTDYKLRCFYTLWNLREAWIKMTGEALLAKWLGDLEFRRFRPPGPACTSGANGLEEGEIITEHEIYFQGRRVDGEASVRQRALGTDYMVTTAVRTPGRKQDALGWQLDSFTILHLDDVLERAERSQAEDYANLSV